MLHVCADVICMNGNIKRNNLRRWPEGAGFADNNAAQESCGKPSSAHFSDVDVPTYFDVSDPHENDSPLVPERNCQRNDVGSYTQKHAFGMNLYNRTGRCVE